MVDFLLYEASLEASVATRSKISESEIRMRKSKEKLKTRQHTVDERVENGHGTSRDTSVRVDLLED